MVISGIMRTFAEVFYLFPMSAFFRYFSFLYIGICLLSACNHKAATDVVTKPDSVWIPKYAKGFVIEYYPNYKCVVVFNPWKKGAVQARYYIVNDKNIATPDKYRTVVAPLHSVVATSASHYAYIAALNQLPSITGVASPQLIYHPALTAQYKAGKIVDLGDAFCLNVEKTMALKPQAVIMSSYNQTDAAAERISQAGIPVLFNNEWTESSPLGRAEWVKFVAVFYNKEKAATALFKEIEQRYTVIKRLAARARTTPEIMVGSSFKGTWYIPSGKGYMGCLLADAKVNYYFANDTTSGSIPLNFEQALQHFSNARVWLNCDARNLSGLLKNDSRYGLFRACKEKQVYSLYNRINATGGNDFWEGGVLHPDAILSDFVKALHPELLPNYHLYYVKKID
jgi:iron complex transport system substrate-binding protein